MKLTKKLEAEVTKVYDTWLHSYLNGDVKTYDSYLDTAYHFIGSTNNEDFLTKKGTTKFFKTTAEQLAGKCQIKNNIRTIEQFDGLVFITERFDANFLIGSKWVYYGKFRFSSVMQKKAEGWRFIYQHFSMPDSKAAEGETLGAEQVSKENQELRDAIKRRTAELEIKNRELEIETSLERVRAVAMSMQKPDDLFAIGKTIFSELQLLGFTSIRNTEMIINHDEKKSITSYHYSDYGKEEILKINYTQNKVVKNWAKELKKAENAFVPVKVAATKLKEWIAYRKKLGYKTDPGMRRAKAVHYYSYSIGLGALSISTWQPLNEEQISLLERFRNVFQLSYKRYKDIEQAEAQTREAQIEVALERVRSRSMAMHKTSELQKVINTVHQELLKLNIGIHGGSFITINSELEKGFLCWGSGGTADYSEGVKIPHFDNPLFTRILIKIKKGPGFFTEAYTQAEKKDFFKQLFKHEPWSKLDAKNKKEVLSTPGGYTRSCSVSKHTSIFIINHFGEKFSDAENEILKRFGKVFEQTYTRFLDLQKAEAQAREAQIELGLERVRARAMAMQTSNELSNLVDTVFKELTNLDMALNWCIINIIDAPALTNMVWAANPDINKAPESYLMKFEDYPFHDAMMKGYKGRKVKFVYTVEGKEKIAYDNYLFTETEFRKVPKKAQSASRAMKRYVCSFSFSNFGGLQTVGEEPLSEENLEILARFGKVFDLTYTRFNDLLKAEAQAREAEIELALERVRARTMAMHNSTELAEVAVLLFEQIKQLGVESFSSGFNIWDDEHKNLISWMSNATGELNPPFELPIQAYEQHQRIYAAWKKRELFLEDDIKGKALTGHYKFLRSFPLLDESFKQAEKAGIKIPDRQVHNVSFFTNGYLLFITQEQTPQYHNLFQRFAKVFDQTYTRFLDLQKAEAQARESEIELALERVRARTMSMQKSDELKEVIQTVYDQFIQLNINIEHTGFILDYKERDDMFIWLADLHKVPAQVTLPYFDCAHWNSFNKAKATGENFFANLLSFKEKNKFYTDLFKLIPGVPQETVDYYFKAAGLAISTVLLDNVCLYIENFEGIPYTDEENDVLMRFGKVFQQTYTRFLDLQKAEAQAREAQIETALEKVRSRSMAMHKSEELAELSLELVKQVQALGVATWFCAFNIYNEDGSGSMEWGSNGLGTFPRYRTPREGVFLRYYKAGQKGETLLVNEIGEEECPAHYEYLCSLPGVGEQLLGMKAAGIPFPVSQIDHVAFFKYGYVLFITYEPVPESHEIFKRFAKVFEQTYTRFLDLQKAEAQAREAQINLAVERIRAKALAMYTSEEILEVVFKLKEEIMNLDIPNVAAATIHLKEENGIYRMLDLTAMEATVGNLHQPFDVSYHLEEADPNLFIRKIWESNENYNIVVQNENDFNVTLNWLRDHGKTKEADETEEFLKTAGITKAYHPNIHLKYGRMSLDLLEPPADEIEGILTKMGAAFDLAYQRFLDLQSAEAQAKESQIQLGLERVRARTMAMQKSDELREAGGALYKELTNLGITSLTIGYVLMDQEEKIGWNYTANPADGTIWDRAVGIPHDETDNMRTVTASWKKQEPFSVIEMDPEQTIKHQTFIANRGINFPYTVEELISFSPEKITLYSFNFKQGYLLIVGDKKLTTEQEEMMVRFSKTFQMTYQRFLDLQKAEAQAREGQIEVSLERIRSRAMAMHNSSELPEVGALLYQELSKLGIQNLVTGYTLMEDEGKMGWNYGVNPLDGKVAPLGVGTSHTATAVMRSIRESWLKQDPLLVFTLNPEETIAHQTFMAEECINFPISKEKLLSISPESLVVHTFNFSQGYLLIVGGTLLTKEQQEMVTRFAKVFEMTYRRFLDLKQAEAQARESQISLALERVRARAMAMQSSDELIEVATELRQQMGLLGQKELEVCAVHLYEVSDEYFESWGAVRPAGMEGDLFQGMAKFPRRGIKIIDEMMDLFTSDAKDYVLINEGEKAIEWFGVLEKYAPDIHKSLIQAIKDIPLDQLKAYWSLADFSGGSLLMVTQAKPDEQSRNLLRRSANVFDLAYRRFKDLKKAEAQTREAQIELSLERIRGQALAMRESADLLDIVVTMRTEFVALNHEAHYFWHMRWLPEKYEKAMTSGDGTRIGMVMELPRHIHGDIPLLAAWEKSDEDTVIYAMDAEEAVDYVTKMVTLGDFKQVDPNAPTMDDIRHIGGLTFIMARTTHGEIGFSLPGKQPEVAEDAIATLIRFAGAFDLAYKRFEDLKTTEQRNREAQIELGLERVRARTMAMQHSDELPEAANNLFLQVQALGIPAWSCGYNILAADKKSSLCYMSSEGELQTPFTLPFTEHESLLPWYDAIQNNEAFFVYQQGGEELVAHYNYMKTLPELKSVFKQLDDAGIELPTFQVNHLAKFKEGFLLFITYEEVPEAHEIFKRFAKVFEQTYTRFLDLKKAEAQARESQIEASLEKVRSRSMAMHSSQELSDVISVVSDQLQQLNIRFDHVSFAINSDAEDYHFWTALYGRPKPYELKVPYLDNPIANRAREVRAKGLKFYQDTLTREENREWLEHAFKHNPSDYLTPEEKAYALNSGFSRSFALMPNIILNVGNYASKPYSDEDNEIIKRFAAVFEQSYTRFLDLKKAEAQAREAQIEAALEKVRSRSLAMHKPEELQEVVAVVAEKLNELGVILDANGVIICTYFPDSKDVMHWMAVPDFSSSGSYLLPYFDHPIFNAAWESKISGDEYFSKSFTKEEKDSFFQYAFANSDYRNFPDEFKQWIFQNDKHSLSFAWAKNSALLLPSHTGILPNEHDKEILKRFARVFEQAYIRFMDLQNAQVLAHKSKIEVALERVRARALAMQEPEELKAVAEVLRHEMGLLGVEELETCSIYINDEKTEKAECWYALKDMQSDEKKLVNDYFTLNLNDTWVGREMLQFYQSKEKQTSILMTGKNRIEWIRMCEEKSVPFRGYYGDVIPDRTYHLYKFSHGAIGAAAAGNISKDSWELLRRAASVFSLAYSRFKDLTQARIDLEKLKTEKQRAEDALTNLKAAQSQLVQSEKMASLGELTAGIAHEIQNPLNFVNNFSEVSKELLDEMKESIEKGDAEEAIEIMKDVIQNLEKINHHGKRADGIVKGMLQHSRSSSGTKEPTDINALADEYLRLAYHGLRAKDKSFNATMNTEYEEGLEKVNVIPQDIGRVMLNLITNAFYAVSTVASAKVDSEYEPTVTVSTKKIGDKVEVSVKDNGGGIPQKILDKIFQPFFTTKPTGQGTGLGLSLAFDIVKSHGGELKVETNEMEGLPAGQTGSEFIIQIPIV